MSGRSRVLFPSLITGTTGLLFFAFGFVAAGRYQPEAETVVDLGVIEVDASESPFFELVFDYESDVDLHKALLPDPLTRVRPRPFHPDWKTSGPHDPLGFRNRSIPTDVDVVTIGDSQTYGWNVELEQNWPSVLAEVSGKSVYNMSIGGWCGLQYRYILDKALRLKPEWVVVGLYMGNDAIECLQLAYQSDHWEAFRSSEYSSLDDFQLKYPQREPESIDVGVGEGEMLFTPRNFVNDREAPRSQVGYQIQTRAAKQMIWAARKAEVSIAFVVIPTKEFVFGPHLRESGATLSDEFSQLLEDEAENARDLVAALGELDVPVVQAADVLRPAVSTPIYPFTKDGHPAPGGHRLIGEAAAEVFTGSGQ